VVVNGVTVQRTAGCDGFSAAHDDAALTPTETTGRLILLRANFLLMQHEAAKFGGIHSFGACANLI
jgi:hypothetical protein